MRPATRENHLECALSCGVGNGVVPDLNLGKFRTAYLPVTSTDYLALFALNQDRMRSIPSSVLTELE
jgi:hypothetical protein